MTAWLLALACGLGAGILSAWGVGGGTLLLLVMTLLLDVDQRTAQGITLLFLLPPPPAPWCVTPAAGLDRPSLRAAVPWAVAAAAAGAWLATAAEPDALRKPFGIYLLLSGVSLLWPKMRER